MATRRQQIITEIVSRLKAITKVGFFETDAGQNVFVGEIVRFGENDPDSAITVVVGDETTVSQRVQVIYDFTLDIQALFKAQLDDPWELIEEMIGDIKNAVELEDRTLGGMVNGNGQSGLVRVGVTTIPREPGSPVIGASVTYNARCNDTWGSP